MGDVTLIIPSLIVIAGVVNDLRSRKVKNALVIVAAILAIAAHFYFDGTSGLIDGGLAFVTAIVIALPLVMIRVIGAGDMKLLAAFALAVNWNAVFMTAVASIFWGALLGVIKAIISGNGLTLLKNTVSIVKGSNIKDLKTTQIPYTVALLFGWMTYVSMQLHGGRL